MRRRARPILIMMSQDLGYLLFPAVVACILLMFKFFLYRGAGGVNDNFTRADRSMALKKITGSSIVFSLAVFVLLQFIRLRIFSDVISEGAAARRGFPFYIENLVFAALLFAELLVLAQLPGNIFSWLSVSRYRAISFQPLRTAPKVAALVPTCDEDPNIHHCFVFSICEHKA
jgi:hypothetical protein